MKKSLSLFFVLVVAFIFIYWPWMFYTTQNATSLNTSKQNEKIEKVEVKLSYHRGSDKLYLYTKNNVYMFDTRWKNERNSYTLAKQLEKELEITIWQHIPRNLISTKNSKQIVDLRDGTTVYLDISEHNKHQQIERMWGISGGVFVSVSVVFLLGLWVFVNKKTIKRKQAKKDRDG